MAKKNDNRKKTPELPKGIELLERGEGWGGKTSRWLKENFSSVVLPLIALIVLGSGVYLYTQQRPSIEQDSFAVDVTDENIQVNGKGAGKQDEQQAASDQKEGPQPAAKGSEVGTGGAFVVQLPRVIETDGNYRLAASSGNGITHLARYALSVYIENEGADNFSDLTPEHKVYIEDWLAKQQPSYPAWLTPDQELSWSKEQITQGVQAARQLTPRQLENLKQFSGRIIPFQ